VLKKGHPRMRGVVMSTSMSSTMKLIGTRKFQILTEMSSIIPAG
jgi:hypothetical protein